jgi:hypothetical protein
LSDEKYITASCVISENAVYKNGRIVFENKDADVHAFLLSIYQYLEVNYPKFYKMDNLSKLGWLASDILLKEAHIKENYLAEETGVILSNADSSLDTDLKYFETVKDMASPALFVYTLPNIMIGEICIRNNFKGENSFFIFEQFDANFIKQYVSNLLNNNNLQICICGWVELFKEEYKAVLFLVENVKRGGANLFTKEQIENVFREPGYINAKI